MSDSSDKAAIVVVLTALFVILVCLTVFMWAFIQVVQWVTSK